MEDPEVFAETHSLILRWIGNGVIDGIRVDHPDGLRDPAEYFHRLRAATPRGWIVAEKILEGTERLRQDWLVDGTTGYDFLNLVGGLFVDPAAEVALTQTYREFTGLDDDLAAVVRASKHAVLRENLEASTTGSRPCCSRSVKAIAASGTTRGTIATRSCANSRSPFRATERTSGPGQVRSIPRTKRRLPESWPS